MGGLKVLEQMSRSKYDFRQLNPHRWPRAGSNGRSVVQGWRPQGMGVSGWVGDAENEKATGEGGKDECTERRFIPRG